MERMQNLGIPAIRLRGKIQDSIWNDMIVEIVTVAFYNTKQI